MLMRMLKQLETFCTNIKPGKWVHGGLGMGSLGIYAVILFNKRVYKIKRNIIC